MERILSKNRNGAFWEDRYHATAVQIRAKGRKIHGSEDEYQLCEGQTDYGGWQDLDNENTFDWDLAN